MQILKAMMAEVCDELMSATRYADDEGMDSTERAYHVGDYIRKVKYLFGPSRGCLKCDGYVRHTLDVLGASEPIPVITTKGLMSIGGRPSDAELDQATLPRPEQAQQ